MATHTIDCWNCKTRNVAAQGRAYSLAPNQSKRSKIWVILTCEICGAPTIESYRNGIYGSNADTWVTNDPTTGDAFRGSCPLLDTFPEPPTRAISNYLPRAIRAAVEDAVRALDAGAFQAAGTAFRTVLDVATKGLCRERCPDATGAQIRTLHSRINLLRDEGILTNDLAEWAHEIRDAGNGFAHDDAPELVEDSENRAREIADFVEILLLYVYDLPGKLAERRAPGEVLPESED